MLLESRWILAEVKMETQLEIGIWIIAPGGSNRRWFLRKYGGSKILAKLAQPPTLAIQPGLAHPLHPVPCSPSRYGKQGNRFSDDGKQRKSLFWLRKIQEIIFLSTENKGFPWRVVDFFKFLYGSLCISMDFYRFPRISMDFNGSRLISIAFYWFLLISMEFYGCLWISMDFDGILLISFDFSMDYSGLSPGENPMSI